MVMFNTPRRIHWEPKETQQESPPPTISPPAFKIRSLFLAEMQLIEKEFIKLNGQFADMDKSYMAIRNTLIETYPLTANAVTERQIKGYVATLHKKVATGQIELQDLECYLQWIKWRCTGLYAKYHSPINQERREFKKSLEAAKVPTTYTRPAFTIFSKRRMALKPRGG
jgi:hypothetical protein